MHFLYILLDHAYGETADLKHGLQDHIDHKYQKGFTKVADDGKLFWFNLNRKKMFYVFETPLN